MIKKEEQGLPDSRLIIESTKGPVNLVIPGDQAIKHVITNLTSKYHLHRQI
jgi:hypothetical protein